MTRRPRWADVLGGLVLVGIGGLLGVAARGPRRRGAAADVAAGAPTAAPSTGGPAAAPAATNASAAVPGAPVRWRTRVVAVPRRCLPVVPFLVPLLLGLLLVSWRFSDQAPDSNAGRNVLLLSSAGLLLGWVVLVLWLVPKRQARLSGQANVGLTDKDLIGLENDARDTLAQILVGLFGLIGFAFTWLQLADSRDATGKTLRITQDGQIAERFAQAVDQIGNPEDDFDVQLGGFYQLERIADDSPEEYHQAVLDVLAGYVRSHAPWQVAEAGRRAAEAGVAADVQAVLTILSREPLVPDAATAIDETTPTAAGEERRDLNLGGTDLRGLEMEVLDLTGADLRETHLAGATIAEATFAGADLSGADLSDAQLVGADLTAARLYGALLTGATLNSATFAGAHLDEATLDGAILTNAILDDAFAGGASLVGAQLGRASLARADFEDARLTDALLSFAGLEGANLRQADLSGADLRGARLRGADLTDATLTGADLSGADVTDAIFGDANLTGANLNGASGLRQDQLDGACAAGAPILTPGLGAPPAPADGTCGDLFALPSLRPVATPTPTEAGTAAGGDSTPGTPGSALGQEDIGPPAAGGAAGDALPPPPGNLPEPARQDVPLDPGASLGSDPEADPAS